MPQSTSIDDLQGQISVLTRDQHRDRYLRSYKLRQPDADVGPGTQPYLDASAHADSCVPLYADAQTIGAATNISTSTGSWLAAQAAARGITADPAVGASGFVVVQTSVGGASIFSGDVIVEPTSGQRFQCVATALYLNGGLVPIEGIDTGASTNLAAGTTLQWSAPRPGCGPVATVFEDADGNGLTGGGAAESDADLQQELIDVTANPPAAGNDAEYQRVIRKTIGIAVQQGFTYPCIKGPGTMGFCFTLRPSTAGASRIPNGAQLAQVLANLVSTEAADDQIFGAAISANPVAVQLQVIWSRKATPWADYAPWPLQSATPMKVDAAVTPTALSVRMTGGSTQVDPQVGQTIAFFDVTNKLFVAKRITAFTVHSAGLSWNLTFDNSAANSNTTYVPVVGQMASPWSDALQSVVAPVVAYFDGLGPGEQVSSFLDPGTRQRRQPEAPDSWPSAITNRITDALFQVAGISDVSLASPTAPYAAPVGTRGVLSYLNTLGDLAVFPE